MNKCDNCTECCTRLGVIELNKPVCTKCIYDHGNCSIYSIRPQTCADYKCAWISGEMGDDISLRPNELGLLITKMTDDIGYQIDEIREDAFEKEKSKWLISNLVKNTVVIMVYYDRFRPRKIIGPKHLVEYKIKKVTAYNAKVLELLEGKESKDDL